MRLNSTFSKSLVGGALLAVSLASWAGISTTRHNLGSTNAIAGANKTSSTADLCVFCHTPHGAQGSVAPLWNKNLNTAGTYTTYSSTTLDATKAPMSGSVSLACLSCHDGTQAMDNIINAPGSGGFAANGGGPGGRAFVWTGNTVDTATGTMINPAGGTNIALIGTDLSNDHPISMQYAGGGCTTTACAPANFRDPDFNTPLTATINGQQVWWLETGGNATRSKTDIILYTRTDFPGSTAAQPSVECASCHDPHTDANPTFLRVANTGSAVCLACHNK